MTQKGIKKLSELDKICLKKRIIKEMEECPEWQGSGLLIRGGNTLLGSNPSSSARCRNYQKQNGC